MQFNYGSVHSNSTEDLGMEHVSIKLVSKLGFLYTRYPSVAKDLQLYDLFLIVWRMIITF